jgi:hypothetical protein
MFGSQLDVFGTSTFQIQLYYGVVLLSMGYMLFKHVKNPFSLFVVALFYYGLFGFVGKSFQDLYKVGISFSSLYWVYHTGALRVQGRFRLILIAFSLFSISFFATSVINGDYFLITFSQYSKFLIILSLFLVFTKYQNDRSFKLRLEKLIFSLLIVQIGLTIAKFAIMGTTESLVGSINAQGGASATYLPILGFMFLWLRNNGEFKLRDWLIVFGFAFIGFVSIKRAIWFIMPIVVSAFLYYIPNRRVAARSVVLALMIVPLGLYLGVRMNSTLNPERKFWGSFDIEWTYNYVYDYSFGSNDNTSIAHGRGGATMMLFEKISGGEMNAHDLLGYGGQKVYATSVEDFDVDEFQINSKGAATGFFQTMIGNGLIGVVTFVIFVLSILARTRNRKLRMVLISFFIWEYFFYTGIVFRDFALAPLMLVLVVFSELTLGVKVIRQDEFAQR